MKKEDLICVLGISGRITIYKKENQQKCTLMGKGLSLREEPPHIKNRLSNSPSLPPLPPPSHTYTHTPFLKSCKCPSLYIEDKLYPARTDQTT